MHFGLAGTQANGFTSEAEPHGAGGRSARQGSQDRGRQPQQRIGSRHGPTREHERGGSQSRGEDSHDRALTLAQRGTALEDGNPLEVDAALPGRGKLGRTHRLT